MKLLLVGDVMLGRLINEALRGQDAAFPWGDTLELFAGADFRICNLECVLADRGSPWSLTPKLFHFRSDSKNIQVLQEAGIDAVSLANNHTLDYGREALLDMLALLDRAGIRHAGAGADARAASSVAVASPDPQLGPDFTIGLIAFTDNEPDWEASDDRAGVFYVPVEPRDRRARRLLDVVEEHTELCDFLVVSAHWGPNWGYPPPPQHRPFARALIHAGADLVFGHSPHVFRGVELYRGKPIIYSAGDFIDDYAIDPVARNDQSFAFLIETAPHEVRRLSLYPTIVKRMQARRASRAEASEISAKMSVLSAQLGTRAFWNADASSLEINLAGT